MHRITRRLVALLACVVGVVGGAAVSAAPKSEDKVKFTVKAAKPESGKQVVTLTLAIEKGWHAYANPVGNADLDPTKTVVTFTSGGKPVPAKIEYPEGKLHKDTVVGDYKIYEGTITIKATIDHTGTDPVEATVAIQVCDEGSCLAPSKVKLKVE
jgi:DsbC/DsbD-like thiol-disulfide interchange protein